MGRKLLVLVLAISAVLLFSSVAMAAPRVAPSDTTIDAGLLLNWAGAGAIGDLNMPLGKLGLRVTAEIGYGWYYYSGLDFGVTGTVTYPVLQEKEFELAVFGGLQAGHDAWQLAYYVGLAFGLAVEVPINSEFTLMAEGMYAPAIGFGHGLGVRPVWGHAGYGIYGVYDLNENMTLNFGLRSIGLYPGFTVGLTF